VNGVAEVVAIGLDAGAGGDVKFKL